MGKITLLSILLLFTLLNCGVKQSKNINSNNVEQELMSYSDYINFDLIKEWVKNKRIVAIGESTHGIGEFYALKSEIIMFLHKELDYEVLAIEGGFADVNLAWHDIENLSAHEIRNKSLYGNFICKEIEPLFQYLKENQASNNPLFYTGFDTQTSGNYYENYLDSINIQLNLGMNLKNEFSSYNKMYQASFEADSSNFIWYKNSYQNTLHKIRSEILKNSDYIQKALELSNIEFEIILRNLDIQYNAVDYSFSNKLNEENMHQGIILRDKLMADNLKWIMENIYPGKKIIIWAHNGHIGKKGINHFSTPMMGEHLKTEFGEEYFSLGLFAYKGNTYQHWTGKSIPFENSDSTSIEYKMKNENYRYTFKKFYDQDNNAWENKNVTALEIENGGVVSFIPSDRFDAAINIYSGDVPTFK